MQFRRLECQAHAVHLGRVALLWNLVLKPIGGFKRNGAFFVNMDVRRRRSVDEGRRTRSSNPLHTSGVFAFVRKPRFPVDEVVVGLDHRRRRMRHRSYVHGSSAHFRRFGFGGSGSGGGGGGGGFDAAHRRSIVVGVVLDLDIFFVVVVVGVVGVVDVVLVLLDLLR